MENYNVENHLFYDGYDLNNELLSNPEFVNQLLLLINEYIFDNKGQIKLIPYFNGKVVKDGGVSGVILGDNFHFTCHTFSFKNTVFIDYFGDDRKKSTVKDIILDTFDTNNYDMGSKDVAGNFGKHIILRPKVLELNDAILMVKLILKEIDMTPITELLINRGNNGNFDLLQPIAESHISFHKSKEDMIVDAFSCKYFDVDKFTSLFGNQKDYIEVNRGISYK